MNPALRLFPLFGILLLTVIPSDISAQGLGGSHTYYVDFNGGSDSAPGTSQSAAWHHAPGDPQASGVPAKVALVPGDNVVFRAGVTYRGSIGIKASGAPGNPVTYTGLGWGNGRAKFSGRDAFDVVAHACSSMPICAKLPNADQLVEIDLPTPVTTYSQIVLDGHILQLSQAPKPAAPFIFDDIATYVSVPSDNLSQLPDGKTWQIQADFVKKTLADDAAGDLLVMLWGYPGVVTSAIVTSYDQVTGGFQFQSNEFKPSKNGVMQFALANHPRLVTQSYEYATADHGSKLIVRAPLNSAKLEISRRAWGFSGVDQKSIAIKGFEIEGFADGPKGGGGSALAVRGFTDILFDGNDVHDLENWGGGGAVSGETVTGFSVTNNQFRDLPHGSGIRIGKSSNVRIVRNGFDSIGRTGVMLMGTQHSLIDHNVLRHLFGSHGNGISIYLDNRDVVASNNLVTDATRAVTFEGSGHPEITNGIVFRANLLKGLGGSALQSWGGGTNGVLIEQNVLLIDNGVQALRLSGKDSNVTVRQNIIDGYQGYPMPLSSDTSIAGNIFVSDSRGSTSGNDEKPSIRKVADTLLGGSSDPKVCEFLLGGTQSATGIGPGDVCKPH